MKKQLNNGLSLGDQYIYTPSTTDITVRWKKMGWIPPTEDPVYQKKWAEFRQLLVAGIESIQ